MEGSFDNDVLIGDARPNAMLGQPGEDGFYGNGGDDVIDARDGSARLRDPVRAPSERSPPGHALTDSFDPPTSPAPTITHGTPVKGLDHADAAELDPDSSRVLIA